jgi:hypothetical protein
MPSELGAQGGRLGRDRLFLALRAARRLHHQLGERQTPEGILAGEFAGRNFARDVVAERNLLALRGVRRVAERRKEIVVAIRHRRTPGNARRHGRPPSRNANSRRNMPSYLADP